MYFNQKLNRQLFLFIVVFSLFAYVTAHTVKFPFAGTAAGAPLDPWGYVDTLAAVQWQPNEGGLPVSRQEAARLFAAAAGLESAELLGELFDGPMDGELVRTELYRLAAGLINEAPNPKEEDYFLGAAGEELPLNMLARLGIVPVPFDRVFLPGESVTREEAVMTLARVRLPELRLTNAPVVVQPKQRYTYGLLASDLQRLAAGYPDLLELRVIGESVEGRQIYAVRLGHGETEIFLDASKHASEWLTTPVLMKMLEDYAHHASYGYLYGGYDVAAMLKEVTFWFIPMVNPDGVTLVLEGPDATESSAFVHSVRQRHNGSIQFRDWKANIRGVDLNRQFPTGWQNMVNVQRSPAPSHFKGYEPLSEPEARALYDFALERRPSMVISYHQRGEFLFWYYRQKGEQLARDRRIVQGLAALTGYSFGHYLTNGGKYRDWAIRELGIPAVVVEVGRHVGLVNEWPRIWKQNRYLGLVAAELLLQELNK